MMIEIPQAFQSIQMRFVGCIYLQTHPHPIFNPLRPSDAYMRQ